MPKLITDNEFYCTKCGSKGLPIVRKTGSERETGHLKKIYCLKCKQEVNHVEVKLLSKYEYGDFLIEYHYGNFNEQGERKEKFGTFKDKLIREQHKSWEMICDELIDSLSQKEDNKDGMDS